MATYGNKLDPHRFTRTAFGVKGNRQSIVIPNTPNTVNANQILTVRFPDLGADAIIVPGTARLAFSITLNGSSDGNRSVVHNLGRAIVKKIAVKLDGNDVMTLDDADIYLCYRDLWKPGTERVNAAYYVIHSSGNTAKIWLGAGDAETTALPDSTIAYTLANRFAIPLDFEILTEHGPFYQAGLANRLALSLPLMTTVVLSLRPTQTRLTTSPT